MGDAVMNEPLTFRGSFSPHGRRRVANPFKGMDGAPVVALVTSSTERNMGSPTGRESYGDGVVIVIDGATTIQGEWESHSQGEARQVIR